MSNGSKREQIYQCGWLWQTGYYAKTKRKEERGMREGWEYKKLGEIINVRTGKLDANASSEDGQYPFFTCSREPLRISSYSYDCECVLVAGNGDLNVKYYNGKFDAYQRTYIITLKESITETSVPYLYKYFTSYIEVLRQRSIGGIIKYIKLGDITNAILPLPPLSMQETIVSELDKINELIRLKKEQLKDYDNLAQSIFYEMFGDPVENEKGWEVKKLINNVQEMFLGPFGSALKVDSYVEKKDAFCMVYEQKHAIKGRLDLDNHFINEEKFNSLKRFEVKGGDFIMSCRGTIGKLYKLPNDAPKGIIHPSLMKIRIKEDVYDSTYFKYMLVKIVANESTNGNCVQMAITAKELGKKTLPLPPLPLQQVFAQRIELIEKQKAEVQRTIKDLETLLASRMQYWFD